MSKKDRPEIVNQFINIIELAVYQKKIQRGLITNRKSFHLRQRKEKGFYDDNPILNESEQEVMFDDYQNRHQHWIDFVVKILLSSLPTHRVKWFIPYTL